jgi:uncharacterized protein (TIGR02466 family)
MNIIQIYSTPLWETAYPNFNDHKQQFLDCVTAFRASNPDGISKSNINGYQSPMNLTNEANMAPLFEFVAQIAQKAMFDLQFVNCDVYISASWANFNDSRNQYNAEHVHQDTFSGVFYLQIPEKSGKLCLVNPGLNPLWQGAMLVDKKNKYNADRLRIEPKEGQILLWPSYLTHSVEPNEHDDTRISVAFNVICVPKEFVEHTK